MVPSMLLPAGCMQIIVDEVGVLREISDMKVETELTDVGDALEAPPLPKNFKGYVQVAKGCYSDRKDATIFVEKAKTVQKCKRACDKMNDCSGFEFSSDSCKLQSDAIDIILSQKIGSCGRGACCYSKEIDVIDKGGGDMITSVPGGTKDDDGTAPEIPTNDPVEHSLSQIEGWTSINLTGDVEEFLLEHNKYRCMHGAGPLTWNTVMANSAATWGSTCCQTGLKHSNSYAETPSSGENLAAGYSTIAQAIKGWYDEVTACGPMPGCTDKATGVVGHFTAMVWKASTQLGCARNPIGWQNRPVYVCRYAASPPNFQGQYTTNVFAATKTADQCGGAAAPAPAPAPTPTPTPTPTPPAPVPPPSCKEANPTTYKFQGATSQATCAELKAYCAQHSGVRGQCPCTCAASAPAPTPAPTPTAAGGGGVCCSCSSTADCKSGSFCCPGMKKCIPSSSQACYSGECRPA